MIVSLVANRRQF